MTPLKPIAAAFRQLDDPVFLRVLAGSVVAALVAFIALAVVVWYGLHAWLGWSAWVAGALGSIGAALLAHYLFLPVAGAVASLFVDPVARAVERRFYPELPPAHPAALAPQIWDGLGLGLRVLLLQLAALLATPLLPGGSALIGYAIAAWAIGRGLFVAVAMRRMTRRDAIALYRHRRADVLVQGGVMVAASLLPIVNLAVPILAVAAMVHVLHADSAPRDGVMRPDGRPRRDGFTGPSQGLARSLRV